MLPTNQNSPSKPFLNWLFTAYFENGYKIEQDQDDKCLTRDDNTGSTFTDVLANKSKLIRFTLTNDEFMQSISVDLISGNFAVNGVIVCVHNQYFEPERYPLELVYFRENRVIANQTSDDTKIMRHYINRYFIGWKTEVNGKTKQVTLAIG